MWCTQFKNELSFVVVPVIFMLFANLCFSKEGFSWGIIYFRLTRTVFAKNTTCHVS